MWSQRITLTDPEKVFIIVKNGYSTASITVGQCVTWDSTAADGLTVNKPTTTNAALFAGVVKDAAIVYGGYGQVQAYGYNSDCLVSGTTDVTVGAKLGIRSAGTNVFALALTSTSKSIDGSLAVALQAFTTSTAAAKKVFLRTM